MHYGFTFFYKKSKQVVFLVFYKPFFTLFQVNLPCFLVFLPIYKLSTTLFLHNKITHVLLVFLQKTQKTIQNHNKTHNKRCLLCFLIGSHLFFNVAGFFVCVVACLDTYAVLFVAFAKFLTLFFEDIFFVLRESSALPM